MDVVQSPAKYGSDMMADVIRALGIEYVALTPGSTIRGLHDSLVNYLGSHHPELITCCHEAIAISMAQGYAKVAKKPMMVMVHDTVGLLNAVNSIYSAWEDQAPMLVIGGTGPMAIEKRRAWIDWVHTALVTGNLVRDFVKWDDQPFSMASVPDSLLRAYRVATTEPQGPVYVCLDADLQEQVLNKEIPLPAPERYRAPLPCQADPDTLDKVAELLVGAEHPIVIADYLGRNAEAVASLVTLADLLALPVIDACNRFNFPNNHPLDQTGGTAGVIHSGSEEDLLKEADVVLALDVPDLWRSLAKVDFQSREDRSMIPGTCKVIHITLHDLAPKSWSQSYGKLVPIDVPIAADTAVALPAITAACRAKLTESRRIQLQSRYARLEARHRSLRKKWQEELDKSWHDCPISSARLAAELGEVIKDEDWVLPHKTLQGWARRLWDWKKPHQYTGGPMGLGGGLGHSLGVALANRPYGRLCIDIQPDGDFLFTPAALWTAAHHQIPLLVVMMNNHSYYNSEHHQELTARQRGRSVEHRGIGTKLDSPNVDYAAMARSYGLYGEGPIENPDDFRPALERALRVVKEKKQLALIDVVTQNR